jgi:hypothetical protein
MFQGKLAFVDRIIHNIIVAVCMSYSLMVKESCNSCDRFSGYHVASI